ncbi:hypothetical protein SporoP37_02100 [Sporosarcina sp. P37]|uniref:hypothetical protein n=1 Tax=unclassified Sporosarcina TaxID=2647733 RepID=UPI000A17A45F|nr:MULTISPECIES: hypothetical protein [unclassified Sporosarcina]ARK23600.1 hypothetical protein SporoP37_02100 [Sporosarcina sp. P37]PID18776.1 hypothetical protein CSV62_06650 [Sporosarcina sp. P35]
MENKMGRKHIGDYKAMAEELIEEIFCTAFDVGYRGAKSEEPSPEDVAAQLVDRYENDELAVILKILDSVIAHDSVKSANQQRAELIQRAREFVEGEKRITGSLTNRKGYEAPKNDFVLCDADFIVNAEKRTVVCLLRGQMGGDVFDRGIAKCMPDEVFNADIGKAIALARALDIEVPQEFMQAVQPSHYSVGQVVKRKDSPLETCRKYRVDIIGKGSTLTFLWNNDHGGRAFCDTTTSLDYEDENIKALQVIDDTNAQY